MSRLPNHLPVHRHGLQRRYSYLTTRTIVAARFDIFFLTLQKLFRWLLGTFVFILIFYTISSVYLSLFPIFFSPIFSFPHFFPTHNAHKHKKTHTWYPVGCIVFWLGRTCGVKVVWDDWVDLGAVVQNAAPPSEKPPPPPSDEDVILRHSTTSTCTSTSTNTAAASIQQVTIRLRPSSDRICTFYFFDHLILYWDIITSISQKERTSYLGL